MKDYSKKYYFAFLAIILLFQLSATLAFAQIRAGASYLKVIPGAEQQGIAGALSGTLDHSFAVYTNPGATGLLREWQLSASYTKWYSGLYHATLLYGMGIRLPWNQRSRFALGISYLGIKDFDSSNGRAPMASGGDLLVSASLGQPLRVISDNLSLGGSVKYLRSKLENFDAGTMVFDVGLLFRTDRFRFGKSDGGLFQEGIFSAGISLTQIGRGMNFINEKTPLPRTLRAGLGLHLGTHDGLQTHLSAEYRSVRDENDYLGIGAEVSWSYFATVRAGYSFEKDNVLRHLVFGASFRFDDVKSLLFNPGRSKALRLNTVKLQSNDFFVSPYSGSLNYYPIGPEYFEFVAPEHGAIVEVDSVNLQWGGSRDPDLFDDTKYWLLVDQDSLKLAGMLASLDEQPREMLFSRLNDEKFLLSDTLLQSTFTMRDLGLALQNQAYANHVEKLDFFWTVIAYDKDWHYRIIRKPGEHITRFRLVLPDLRIHITDCTIDSTTLGIADSTVYGMTQLVIENRGLSTAKDFVVTIQDSTAGDLEKPPGTENVFKTIVAKTAALAPGEDRTLTARFLLRDNFADRHNITAIVDDGNHVVESRENNNTDTTGLAIGYDLSLRKLAHNNEIRAGEVVNYSLYLSNSGPAAAREFALTDILPPNVRPVRFSHTPEVRGDTLRWNQTTLDKAFLNPGETVEIEYEVRYELPSPPESIILEGVNFALNSPVFVESLLAEQEIEKTIPVIRRVLAQNPNAYIEISGHSDISGSDAINDPLSQRRANRVKAYLIERDPLFERLVSRGYGSKKPLYSNDTREGRRKNRRVEINLPALPGDMPESIVNHSQVKSPKDLNQMNDFASDTIYVSSPPPPLVTYEELKFQYDTNADRLKAEFLSNLVFAADTLTKLMRANPEANFEIIGYADNVGNWQYNEGLSLRRARNALKFLIADNFSPDKLFSRFKTVGYGEREPVADNSTENGRRQNRRIEFRMNGDKIAIRKGKTMVPLDITDTIIRRE